MESIRCATPPLKGVVDVSASFDGMSFGASQLFTYELPPAVTEAVLEDDQLLVRGSGFVNTSALSCRVDGMDVRATYLSEKEIVCHSRVAGDLDHIERRAGLLFPLSSGGARLYHHRGRFIRRASSEGGEVIPRDGPNFAHGAQCAFGDRTVKARLVNDKELTCIVPSSSFDGALLTAPLTVRRGDITSSPVAFYYYASVETEGAPSHRHVSNGRAGGCEDRTRSAARRAMRRLVLFIKWKQHALKVRRRARPRRFL